MEIIIISAFSVFMGICIASIIWMWQRDVALKRIEEELDKTKHKILVLHGKHLRSIEEIDS